jgi:osmotically-inducible protein OsmY
LYHFGVRVQLVALVAVLGLIGCFRSQLTEAELSDPGIKARLEERLRADRRLDLRYVTVDVHHSIVTVSGVVSSWDDRREIERIARRLDGPEQVLVNLAIQE